MLEILLRLIGALILLFGVVCIYDARLITRTKFNFGNENDTTSGFKIFGTLLCIVGGLMLYI